MKVIPVIMCGGSGTRLWPESKKNLPKQFIDFGGWTLFQKTIERIKNPIFDYPIISTNILYEKLIHKFLKKFKVKDYRIILEPVKKNTAPAILSSALLKEIPFDQPMIFFPADHLIVGHNHFEKSLNSAFSLVKKEQILVTIGIKPSYPSTAYGYIQYEPGTKNKNGYHVKTFAEKPHETLAKRFIKSGDFLWNAGIFVWEVKSLLLSLEKHMPELHDAIKKIGLRIEKSDSFDDIWESILPESIDYGLMEKANNIFVIPAEFEWNDLGSWDALYDIFSKKENDNVVRCLGTVLEGKNNFIQSKDRFTAVIGIDDVVVVNTDDATLIVPRNKVEKVKDLVAWLDKKNHKELL